MKVRFSATASTPTSLHHRNFIRDAIRPFRRTTHSSASILKFTSRESSHFFGGIPRGITSSSPRTHSLRQRPISLSFARLVRDTSIYSVKRVEKNIRNGKRDARPERNWNIVSLISSDRQ